MLVLVTCKEAGSYEHLIEGRFYFAESETLCEKCGVFYVVVYNDLHKKSKVGIYPAVNFNGLEKYVERAVIKKSGENCNKLSG